MKIKETHNLVTANSYTTAKHELDFNEEKLFYCAIVSAREYHPDLTADDFVQVDALDFARLTNIDAKSAYSILRKTAESLETRKGIFYEPDPLTGKPSKLSVPMVTGARYVEGLGILRLRFSPEILKYFVQQGENFTKHQLGFVTQLSTQYAMRLYRLFQMERFKVKDKGLELTVAYIRELLSVEDKYSTYSNFKRRVVDESLEQINAHTEISVTYEVIRRGRETTGFRFYIEEKNKLQQSVDDPQTVVIAPRKKRVKRGKEEVAAARIADLQKHSFDRFESDMFFKITSKYKEISRDYVVEVAATNKISILQALVKIDSEYKGADEFSLSSEE